MTKHTRDDMGICTRCGQGLSARDLLAGVPEQCPGRHGHPRDLIICSACWIGGHTKCQAGRCECECTTHDTEDWSHQEVDFSEEASRRLVLDLRSNAVLLREIMQRDRVRLTEDQNHAIMDRAADWIEAALTAALPAAPTQDEGGDNRRGFRKLENVQAILAAAQSGVNDAVRELSLACAALAAPASMLIPCRAMPERHDPAEPPGLSCRLDQGHRGYHRDGNWAWPESNVATTTSAELLQTVDRDYTERPNGMNGASESVLVESEHCCKHPKCPGGSLCCCLDDSSEDERENGYTEVARSHIEAGTIVAKPAPVSRDAELIAEAKAYLDQYGNDADDLVCRLVAELEGRKK